MSQQSLIFNAFARLTLAINTLYARTVAKFGGISPVFTYSGGVLTKITYSDGSTKDFNYSNGVLTSIVYKSGAHTFTKVFNYSGGALQSITETIA